MKKQYFNLLSLILIFFFSLSCDKQIDDVKNKDIGLPSPEINILIDNNIDELIQSTIKYQTRDVDNALFYAHKLLKQSEIDNNDKGKKVACYVLGYVYHRKQLYIASLDNFFNALRLAINLKDLIVVSQSYQFIGIIHHKVGLYEKAIRYYKEALNSAPKDDKSYIAKLYWDIAITYRENKQYKEAEEHFIKSAGIQKELGNQEELADVYNSLGNLFKETGAYEKALSYLSQSLAISESMNHAELMALALHNTGYVLYQQKKYTEAKEYYTKALAQSEKVNDFPELLIWIHRDMGLNELALKEAEKAIPYLEKGEAIAQGSKQTKLEIELTAILSQVYKKLRNIDKALYYSEKSRSIQAENLIPEIKRLGDEFEKKNTIDGFKENSIQKREGDSNRFFYIVLSSLISLLVGGSGIYFIKRRQNKTMGGKGKLVEIEERLEMVLTKVAEVMKNKSSYSQLIQQEAQAIYAKMQEIEAHQQHISKRGISKRKLKELWDMLQNSKSFLALANQQKANSIDHS